MEKNDNESNISKFFSNVLFVSDLPKEIKMKDLEKLFSDYKYIKGSLNNSKANNIYAQIILQNEEMADKARHELNGYFLIPDSVNNDISKGKHIRICKYHPKSKIEYNRVNNVSLKKDLFIKNISLDLNQKEFYDIFLKYGDIFSGKIEYDDNGKSKGYGYIYYYNELSAENAKNDLNGKEFYGKKIQIEYFNPNRIKKNDDLTLFVQNLPSNITEKDIENIFGKYGKIININLSNKYNAYITYQDHNSVSKCLIDIKKNPISFSGLPEIIVKHAISKEERDSSKKLKFLKKNLIDEDSCKVLFQLIKDEKGEIKNKIELDKSIRLFIKIIFLMEYIPKSIEIKFETKSGIIIFNNIKETDLFLEKYNEFVKNNKPMFLCISVNKIKNYISNNKNNSDSPIGEQNNSNNLFKNIPNNKNHNYKNSFSKNVTNLPFTNFINEKIIEKNKLLAKNCETKNDINKQNLLCYQINSFENKNNFLNLYNNSIYLKRLNIPINNINLYKNFQGKNSLINSINPYNLQTFPNYNNSSTNNQHNINIEKNYTKNHISNNAPNINYNDLTNSNFKGNNSEQMITYLCDCIYSIVYKKYPNEASKITGMIKELGPKQIISLLSNPDYLNQIIEKGYNMIIDNKKNK